eukprot:CAMPEP_0202458300 /NCGR_PEP_ID=MMETSP1360-20130828/24394_1 /ASSEMBLY_ACC=CAM_ASM_000848 /TAXON_ID=515479 /ORGANISM="Licmophora paradoxa, Strain CCMP2313" /LENGTH=217 /DNA_ID=CAMNT_0049078785 /DNA_START=22 /DNA_END=675 /DNA_ORIENTATION=+
MKLTLITFLPLAGAFAPATFTRPSSTLSSVKSDNSAARPDTSQFIKSALEATEKFGAQSSEARLAWEAVEEMDASDNSNAFAGGLDDDCAVDEETVECKEYSEKLDELNKLISENQPLFEKVRTAATDLRAIKMSPPAPAAGKDSPELQAAIKEAKASTEAYGITSTEAVLAWETVEEIASSSVTPALGGKLEDDCLVETIEACEALEEVGRALNLN